MLWRNFAFTAILFFLLAGCSTYDAVFSNASPKQAQAVEIDSLAGQQCARVAHERADDAVIAFYVSEDSPEQRDIYQSTYRDCLAWHDR